MDILEAIEKRISCRAFTDTPVEQKKIDILAEEIRLINRESGLSFQLYGPRGNGDGTAIDMSSKMFSCNPPLYAALVGPDDPISKEKVGYYGEGLVLLATQLGLSTCWVASTYDQKTTRAELREGWMLHDVIPIGYAPKKMPLKQRTIRSTLRGRSKKPADLWRGSMPLDQAPAWIQACIEAVCKAPSAINGQPVVFVREAQDQPIRAELVHENHGQERTDLGIAKLHFELVASAHGIEATWEWGDKGIFGK